MTDRAPVSVIIPAYNSEDLIGETIQSVHAQTLSVSEIIVVDDGSSDETSKVAESLGAIVIRQPNRGVSAARNVGIRAATKPWIALLDQDDIWQPEKIEFQWAALQLYPNAGLISCNMSWFEDERIDGCSTVVDPDIQGDLVQKDNLDASISYFPRVQNELPLSRMYDNPSSVLIRRDLLLSIGLFDESLRFSEDLDCFLRVVTHCPLVIVRRSLVRHRIHTRNTSNNASEVNSSYLRLLDRLHAQPEKYPPGAARAYYKDLRRWPISTGRSLLDEGRRREARALFAQSLKKTYSLRAIFLWCLTLLSPAAFKELLTIKRKLSSIKEHRQLGNVANGNAAGRAIEQLSEVAKSLKPRDETLLRSSPETESSESS
jgi:glycosyltransferase involved in cell wall biosynthesis